MRRASLFLKERLGFMKVTQRLSMLSMTGEQQLGRRRTKYKIVEEETPPDDPVMTAKRISTDTVMNWMEVFKCFMKERSLSTAIQGSAGW